MSRPSCLETWRRAWTLALLLGGGALPAAALGLAHGVFVASPDQPEDAVPESQLAAYVQSVGRDVAFVYFTNNWFRSRAFPAAVVHRVRARGAVPIIRLMLRSSDEAAHGPDPVYSPARIVSGALDADLRAWARQAAAEGGPLYVEYGTEVNGDWFAWNAAHNGREAGAALFVQAYRHIVNVFRAAGANNVRWVFHVASADDPQTPWNRFERYYPGGDVISVLGVSAYGAQTPNEKPIATLRAQLDAVLPRLEALAPGKPVLLLEFGSVAGAQPPPERWAEAALADLTAGRWPALRGFAWWNSAWPNGANPAHFSELRVERQPALAAVFRRSLGHPCIRTTLDLTPDFPTPAPRSPHAP